MSAAARLRLRALARPLVPALAVRLLWAVEQLADGAALDAYAARIAAGDGLAVTLELLASNPPRFDPDEEDDRAEQTWPRIQPPRPTRRPDGAPGEIRGGFAELERAARADSRPAGQRHAQTPPALALPYCSTFAEQYADSTARLQAAAMLDGRHYATYPPDVAALKRAGEWDAAAVLLERLVATVESESAVMRAERPNTGAALAPRYYVQLAMVRRKQGRYAEEIAACDRFLFHPAGWAHPDLVSRRARAAQLLGRS